MKYTNNTPDMRRMVGSARGAATLLYVIIMTVVMGILITSMLTMFNTANQTAVEVSNYREAYYMAESGLRFSITKLNDPNFDYTLLKRLEKLNQIGTFIVDPNTGEQFDVDAFVLGQLLADGAQHASGGDQLIMKQPGDEPFSENFSLPVAGDSAGDPYLVSAHDVATPNDQNLVRITAVTVSSDRTKVYLTVQDSTKVIDNEEMFLAVRVIAGGQAFTEGGSLTVESFGEAFPDEDGVITIGTQEYQYTTKTDNGDGTYTFWGLHKPKNGTWTADDSQSNLGNDDFVILNSENHKNIFFTITGYAGVGGAQSVQAAFALGDTVALSGGVEGDDPDTSERVIYAETDELPSIEMLYGSSLDGEYQGAHAEDGTALDYFNRAELSYGTATGDRIIFVGRTGDYEVQNNGVGTRPDVFYFDVNGVNGYETGIRLDDTPADNVATSTDFIWLDSEWIDFEVSYNYTENPNEVYMRFEYQGSDVSEEYWVEIADVANDPDFNAPMILAPDSNATRYISNFFISARGFYQNGNLYFYSKFRNVQVWKNGYAWPDGTWLPDYDYNNGDIDGQPQHFVTVFVDHDNDGVEDEFVFRCITSGTSGETDTDEPNWSLAWADGNTDHTVNDNTVVWTLGLPDFDPSEATSQTQLRAYLLSQFRTGAQQLRLTGQFQQVWVNVKDKSISVDYGTFIHFLVNDVVEASE